jgi:hypothetical protein
VPWADLSSAARSPLTKHFRDYLVTGGFPEAQGTTARDRSLLLRSFVDVALLRDVIERHQVSNPTALRWMQRRALSSAAAAYPHATPLLLTFDPQPPRVTLPRPLVWQAAGAWLLGDPIRGRPKARRT